MKNLIFTLIAFVVSFVCADMGIGLSQAADKTEQAEEEIPAIVLGAELSEEHPEIEGEQICMECHTIKTDAVTTATQRSLQKKGVILKKDDLWKEIVEFFGERQSCVLATCINNEPYVTTIDLAFDPVNKVMYGLSEKGTQKLGQMKMNPKVAVEFHNQKEWEKMVYRCLQMRGHARVFSGDDPQFDEGLKICKFDRERISAETVKRGMEMTCFTPKEILSYDTLRKKKGVNIFQLWKR